ncbi:MAG: hypothetical protein QXP98_02440 [Thermoproteus sp.]
MGSNPTPRTTPSSEPPRSAQPPYRSCKAGAPGLAAVICSISIFLSAEVRFLAVATGTVGQQASIQALLTSLSLDLGQWKLRDDALRNVILRWGQIR